MRGAASIPLVGLLLVTPGLLSASTDYDNTDIAPGTHLTAIGNESGDHLMEIKWSGKVSGTYYQEIVYSVSQQSYDDAPKKTVSAKEGTRTKVNSGLFTHHVTVPKSYLQERNYFFIERRSYKGATSTTPVKTQRYYGLEFDKLSPKTITLVEGQVTPRNHPTSTIIRAENEYYRAPYRIYSTNLPLEEVDPLDGIFPLGMSRLHQTDPYGNKKPVLSQKGYLIIKTEADSFEAGESYYFENRRCVRFPIVLKQNGNKKESIIASTGRYAVSKDGRRFVDYGERQNGDLATSSIFFPPVKTGENRKYECVYLFENSGEALVDTLRYDFVVWRTKNEFGSCSSSAYCLEEIG